MLANFIYRDSFQSSNHLDDLDYCARLIPVFHNRIVSHLILFAVLPREHCFDVLGAIMRIPDIAVRAVGFNHNSVERYLLYNIAVVLSLHGAPIDPNIKVEVY
jgi:hypothetical protein